MFALSFMFYWIKTGYVGDFLLSFSNYLGKVTQLLGKNKEYKIGYWSGWRISCMVGLKELAIVKSLSNYEDIGIYAL